MTRLARSVWTQTQALNSTLSAQAQGPAERRLQAKVLQTVPISLLDYAQNLPTSTGDSGSPQHSGCDVLLLNSINQWLQFPCTGTFNSQMLCRQPEASAALAKRD